MIERTPPIFIIDTFKILLFHACMLTNTLRDDVVEQRNDQVAPATTKTI